MTTFIERLRQAAAHAGIGDKQANIAGALGVKRQTVNRWFVIGGEPDTHLMFHIAATFGVDPKWLKSGEGAMQPTLSQELPQDERDLLRDYRNSTRKVRDVIRSMARAARKVAVVVAAAAIPPLMLLSPQESNLINNAEGGANAIACVLCKIARRAWQQLGRLIIPLFRKSHFVISPSYS